MKRVQLVTWCMLFSLVLFQSSAYPWGSAVHAFIADHCGKKDVVKNLQEMYGLMSADIYVYQFEDPHQQELSDAAHNQSLKVWEAAHSKIGKALAYGFVAHNDQWGADFTAHHRGVVSGTEEGYIVEKAKYLLTIAPPPQFLTPEKASSFYHILTENAIDILLKRADTTIGQKIIIAAIVRSPTFPLLLVKAYAVDFAQYYGDYYEAAKAIVTAEVQFQNTMIIHGQALSHDEETAVVLVSQQMLELAEGFLGGPLPIPEEEALALIKKL
ncbi:MAG: hypothetical protein JW795_01015, partial [Chitinivibrionales bacterium]|nr:hypothetical protein [Chitinivibrionales bacterium]